MAYTDALFAMLDSEHGKRIELQRMVYAAALALASSSQRTRMLNKLSTHPDLHPDMRSVLLASNTPRVRAAVWRRGDASLDEVRELLKTEKALEVRAAALTHPDFTAVEVVELMGKMRKQHAEAFLMHDDRVDASLVVQAVRSMLPIRSYNHGNKSSARFAKWVKHDDLAHEVFVNTHMHPQLRMLAASSMSVSSGEIAELFPVFEGKGWRYDVPTEVVSGLLLRSDFHEAAREKVKLAFAQHHSNHRITADLDGYVAFNAKTSEDQLVAIVGRLRMRGVNAHKAFWSSLNEGQRTSAVAEALLRTAWNIDSESAKLYRTYLTDPSPKNVVQILGAYAPSWVADMPDVWEAYIRSASFHNVGTNAMHCSNPRAALTAIAEALLTHDKNVDVNLWPYVLADPVLGAKYAADAPMSAVVATVRLNPDSPLMDVLFEVLMEADCEDVDVARERASALDALYGSTTSASAAVQAALMAL